MDVALKKKYQRESDLAGAYGVGILGSEINSFECRFGLWLNINRIETRRGRSILVGVNAALADGPSKELIDSLCENDEQAEAIYNLAKSRAEFLERNQDGHGEW